MSKPGLKAEAIRLRREERLSYKEIRGRVDVSMGSLTVWLKPFPLTDEEKKAKLAAPRFRPGGATKSRGEASKFHQAVLGATLTRSRKGMIAEAAVLFRLVLHGFKPYRMGFDGDATDLLVETATARKIHRIQIKYATQGKHGLPTVSLGRTTWRGGKKAYRERYRDGEFDFLVGYNLYNDTAYVFSEAEVKNLRTGVTVSDATAERWDKLR